MSLYTPFANFQTAGAGPTPVINPFTAPLGTGGSVGGNTRIFIAALDPVDGNLVLGGDTTTFNGSAVNGVWKVDTSGNVVQAYNPSNRNVRALFIDSDYVYVGLFSSPWFEVFDRSTGAAVTGWISTWNSTVRTFQPMNNGNIIAVAGQFTSPGNGQLVFLDKTTKQLATGWPTHTFNVMSKQNTEPRFLTLDPDGKLLFGGPVSEVNGSAVNSGFRMNNDGSVDNTFATDVLIRSGNAGGAFIRYFNVSVNGVKQYLAGGTFFEAKINGSVVPLFNHALLDEDGQVASTWTPQTGEAGGNQTYTVDNENGFWYFAYRGSNQSRINGVSVQNNNRTLFKMTFNNQYVGDANWMTNNVTTAHDPLFNIYCQTELGASSPYPMILLGAAAFTTYAGTTGIGSIALTNLDGSLVARS
jgi:hypothetical protein